MDEVSSRSRNSSRRMATSKPAPTTRRSRSKASPSGDDQPEISRATWAGVTLVFAALLGAVGLAVVSPSDSNQSAQVGAVPPTPAASAPADGRLPAEQPRILLPTEGETIGEWEIPVTAAVPEDALPRKLLTLEILRDGEVLGRQRRPEPGDVVVQGIRLNPGANVLTAVLRGPGGLGPLSGPVTVVLDRTPTTLTVTAPKDGRKTFEARVVVIGSSEPGAKVEIKNSNKDWADPAVVGPSGSFEKSVPLVAGRNRIVVKATDTAGNVRRITRFVIRQDGRPTIKLNAPKGIRVAALPANAKVQVDVTDADGKSIEGADVVFALTIPGQSSETSEAVTNESGRATWRVPIPRGSSRGDVILVNVKVTGANGQSREGLAQIKVN